jgi:DNA-binding response OmpR family regulator
MSVLIVDDDHTTTLLVQHMARKLGFVCEIAFDGSQAVRAASNSRFDYILMDVYMPVLNGLDAAREIRSCCPESNSTVIIGLLSGDGLSMRSRCIEAGMDDVAMKPIDMSVLRWCFSLRRQQQRYLDSLSISDPSDIRLAAGYEADSMAEERVSPKSNISNKGTDPQTHLAKQQRRRPQSMDVQSCSYQVLGRHRQARTSLNEVRGSSKVGHRRYLSSIRCGANQAINSTIIFRAALLVFLPIIFYLESVIAARPRLRGDELILMQ